ncbi:5'-3'-deoxyribonucleotidase [Bacillus velezensis]|uniref:5' nucleotidase, NT5C type n=1 Tax=Bacillus velezensis TaxID=492670 RepID=UPI00145C325C|nr:5'-3'-deoxyribonucleotidase [Bacillus velezensis]MCA1233261.1 5'-3'-deoxyribonucleotidase [Bacillus velezensis]MCA1311361.1 5'-3'-deoxyribonucleotidase [Bacillus velezensis]MCA1330402.1 5'-3'-deoxyribonucleotidase [Bacillus velezensis]NMP63604.1 5'-3'-deoxyribonucleotidase [Bacillus velezensis]
MKKVIAIDMDQVLADLLSDWVAYINTYDDPFLKEEDILCWDISKYSNTQNNVYRLLDYELFRNLDVIEGSQRAVKELTKKYEVYVVTTATNHPESLKAKLEWLTEHFPFIPHSNVVLCGNKNIIKADIMIDDGIHNLETFDGMKILFDAPHNRDDNRFIRVMNWEEIERKLL